MRAIHHIILALGANTQASTGMRKAQAMLREVFPDVRFSRQLWTPPIGIEGAPFRNCLAFATTEMGLQDVCASLKDIERCCGRNADDDLRHEIWMDVDLLQYDAIRYHQEDWKRPYVVVLMKEMNDNKL